MNQKKWPPNGRSCRFSAEKNQNFYSIFHVFQFRRFFHSRLRKLDFLCLFILATKFICIETRMSFNIAYRFSSIEDAGVYFWGSHRVDSEIIFLQVWKTVFSRDSRL